MSNLQTGGAKVISASANISSSGGQLLGVFVSTASGSPTIAIYDSATTTTTLPLASQFIPVAATFYKIPVGFSSGLYVAIGGTVSCTMIYA